MGKVIQKHSRLPRTGEAEPVYTPQRKQIPAGQREVVMEDAKALILRHWTIDEVARKHGVAPQTLDYWFSTLGDEDEEIRTAWLNALLVEAGDMLRRASNPIAIAQARELWKRATWYAERLDRKHYGQDQPHVHFHVEDLGERLRRARERERVLEHSPDESHVIAVK